MSDSLITQLTNDKITIKMKSEEVTMLKCKRVIGIILAVMFIASVIPMGIAQADDTINIYSTNTITRIEEILSNAAQYPEMFKVEFGKNIELGTEINVYRLDSKLQKTDDIKYYPVLSDSRVVAIVNVFGDAISFGKDFADELQAFLDINEAFALVYEGKSLYAVSANQRTLLQERYDSQSRERGNQSVINSRDLIDRVELAEILPLYDLAVTASKDINGFQTLSATSFNLSVPIKPQPTMYSCWAACIASIGQFRTGINKDAWQVVQASLVGAYSGATPEQVRMEFIRQYSLGSTVVNNAPNFSTIISDIRSGRPIVGGFYSSNPGIAPDPDRIIAHAVVISGYNQGISQFMLTYMEPDGGFFRTTSTTRDGIYTIVNGGRALTWWRQVRMS
jgi:hypothetical protein